MALATWLSVGILCMYHHSCSCGKEASQWCTAGIEALLASRCGLWWLDKLHKPGGVFVVTPGAQHVCVRDMQAWCCGRKADWLSAEALAMQELAIFYLLVSSPAR